MAITLLRHTQPEVDDGVCYGQLDLSLADTFDDEFKSLITKLNRPQKILSSPLQRCSKLASSVAAAFNMDYQVDPRLTEMDFGTWEGTPWDALPRTQLDDWAQNFLHATPHGGESVAELTDRVSSLMRESKKSRHDTLWVTHAGVIKCARYLLAKDQKNFDWSESIGFGGILKL